MLPTALGRMAHSLNVFRHHPHARPHDLQEPAPHGEPGLAAAVPYGQGPPAEERHEGRVIGQDAHLTVERRGDDGVRVAVEHSRLRRDYRDSHHEPASFFAFSTASSIVPTM